MADSNKLYVEVTLRRPLSSAERRELADRIEQKVRTIPAVLAAVSSSYAPTGGRIRPADLQHPLSTKPAVGYGPDLGGNDV
jgi:hypothetical protein